MIANSGPLRAIPMENSRRGRPRSLAGPPAWQAAGSQLRPLKWLHKARDKGRVLRARHDGLVCPGVMTADCGPHGFAVILRRPHTRQGRVEAAGAGGSQGLSVRLWARIPGRRRPRVPDGADDMMDCLCHCRYRQWHSAADKTAALPHAEEAAIFLPGFGVRALPGVSAAEFEMSHWDRPIGSLKPTHFTSLGWNCTLCLF